MFWWWNKKKNVPSIIYITLLKWYQQKSNTEHFISPHLILSSDKKSVYPTSSSNSSCDIFIKLSFISCRNSSISPSTWAMLKKKSFSECLATLIVPNILNTEYDGKNYFLDRQTLISFNGKIQSKMFFASCVN